MKHEEEPFYGHDIYRNQEHQYIKKLLAKYKDEPVSEELKQKVWDELQLEKYLGHLTIPFKVVLRRDSTRKFPDYVEVILDTKV